MPPMDFGSGSALLGQGAGNALQEAMQRRQTGQAGVTAQQTPAASPQMPPPQGQAPAMATPGPQANQSQSGTQPPQTLADIHAMENQIILKALAAKLASNSDVQEAKTIPPKPPTG